MVFAWKYEAHLNLVAYKIFQYFIKCEVRLPRLTEGYIGCICLHNKSQFPMTYQNKTSTSNSWRTYE